MYYTSYIDTYLLSRIIFWVRCFERERERERDRERDNNNTDSTFDKGFGFGVSVFVDTVESAC